MMRYPDETSILKCRHSSNKSIKGIHFKSKKIRKGTRPGVEKKFIPRDSAGLDVLDVKETDDDDMNKLIEELVQNGQDHMGPDLQDIHLQESTRRDKEINHRFQFIKRLIPYPLLMESSPEEDDIPDSLSVDNHEMTIIDLDPVSEDSSSVYASWLP
eukprot:g4073.t1